MNEIIERIDEVADRNGQDGFAVVTNKQTIQLLIDNGQCCCESWGYFWSNDKPEDFVGATLNEVTITDMALNTKALEASQHLDEGGVMFVSLQTDRGTLQFVAYNAHNGYYGHTATLISEQLTHSECL